MSEQGEPLSRRRRRRGAAGAKEATRAGVSVPWIPVAFVLAVAVAAGIGLFVVLTRSGGSDNFYAAAAGLEADPAPDLPGEFVNIPKIYDASYPNTATHVKEDVDYVRDGNSNPPAGGPHWGSASCGTVPSEAPPFCGPVPLGIYRDAWPTESLIHNMEHGAVVIWYNTADQEVVGALEALAEERLNAGDPLVLVPYPEMEDEQVVVTGWTRIDKFSVEEFTPERVETFLDAHICRFNPEDQCRRLALPSDGAP
ncbi:MAG: DUF3105 domain-containing protein [Dehalococcoidia bacterium]|nr:DUF3105 domain-containing protein [Dehalococcoidia bacterium]